MQVYFDEPRVVWRAQRAVFADNVRLIRSIALPVAILALPMAWLVLQLDANCGHLPLSVGEPALVVAQLKRGSDTAALLQAPEGIAIETPAVHSDADGQIAWRIRPARTVTGKLTLTLDGRHIQEPVVAGDRASFRSAPLPKWLFTGGNVRWVEVRYPPARGVQRYWLVWFLAISTAAAAMAHLVFKSRRSY